MRYIKITIALLLLPFTLFSQDDISLRDAEELLGQDNIVQAIKSFETQLAADPENPELLMRLGFCYYLTPSQKEKAPDILQKATELYKEQNLTKAMRQTHYYEAKFYWAKSLSKNYQFDDAEKIFKELRRDLKKKKKMKAKINHEIQICKTAKKMLEDMDDVVIVSPFGLNSEFDDHTPLLQADGTTMVFTSKRNNGIVDELKPDGQYSEDIFYTQIEDRSCSSPILVDKALATGAHESNCGFSPDGSRLFLYTQGDIYFSQKSNSHWSIPEPFIDQVNSKKKENHICINSEETTIYFSSSRRGGFGGMDIYKLEKDDQGHWGQPVNLGKNINTEHDDDGPFIHEDGTLYFASKGHETMGGFDVFKAESDDKGNFKKPENLGFPINSVEEEVYFFMSKDNKQGYFSSTRKGGAGRSDIYMADFADSSKVYLLVKGEVYKEGGDTEDIEVNITDINGKKKMDNVSMQEGSFVNVVEKGKEYYAVFESEGYFFETVNIDAPKDSLREKNYADVELKKIKKGEVSKEYNIDFNEENNSDIEDENKIFMKTLSNFMKGNPDLFVDISSGGNNDNIDRKKRNQNIIDYLTKEGIDEKRIYTDINDNSAGSNSSSKITIMDEMVLLASKTSKSKQFPPSVEELSSGNKITGEYTIQIGAFKKKKSLNDKYFSEINTSLKMKKGKDGLHRYTYGKYDYKSDAQQNLEIIHSLGFKDAFIRELKWYE